ncbi:MAG: D-cysteine desulfhydrase family protein [Myxococcales bacterium]|nr:D-cysteine desulfhydrase family protein [Myxococcales bacterium]
MPTFPARVDLARLPTPVQPLPHLSRELGVRLFVKRDDLTGAALSGNKVRKLEYLLAEALDRRADVVLTCGSADSNHCRATAAAARQLGLGVELLLKGLRGASGRGNLLLDRLLGATLHDLTPEEFERSDALLSRRAQELAAAGSRAYVIPMGGSSPLGALGYVRCAEELAGDQRDLGVRFDVIVSATGSGGTLAGLLAGAELYGLTERVIGVPVSHDGAHFQRVVGALLDGIRGAYAPGLEVRARAAHLCDGFVGDGYGLVADDELRSLRDLAARTGLILDPVYTNKAFAGLLGMIRSGAIAKGETALFVHTGGLFGLFPFQERLRQLDLQDALPVHLAE